MVLLNHEHQDLLKGLQVQLLLLVQPVLEFHLILSHQIPLFVHLDQMDQLDLRDQLDQFLLLIHQFLVFHWLLVLL